MDLLLIALWSFLVAVAGGLAGLVLGNLRLPLILQFSSSASAGAGANVAVSAASALAASIAHWRGGRIDWRLFWLMAPPSLLGGIVGGVVSGSSRSGGVAASRYPTSRWALDGDRDRLRRRRARRAGRADPRAVPGAYLGAQLTGRLDDEALLKTIAVILVVAGISLGVQAIVG